MIDFSADLETTRKTVENALKDYMRFNPLPQKRVFDAMEYSLLAGGKRLRPIIMIYVCQMCGGSIEDVLPFACAIEMIHTYSLIHDDLPAMDNDDLRRGKPTNHIKFDEATAILAGDALLNMAFEITSEYSRSNISDKSVLRAVSALAKAAGAMGMIGGQMIDIESENKSITLEELKNLHSLKTGALIRAAGICGALIAGADDKMIDAIDKYCINLGIAFQIRDDILDVSGDEKTLGKPIGSDAKSNKNTYVSLMSIEEAEKLVNEYTKSAISALNIFKENSEKLSVLAHQLTERTN